MQLRFCYFTVSQKNFYTASEREEVERLWKGVDNTCATCTITNDDTHIFLNNGPFKQHRQAGDIASTGQNFQTFLVYYQHTATYPGANKISAMVSKAVADTMSSFTLPFSLANYEQTQ